MPYTPSFPIARGRPKRSTTYDWTVPGVGWVGETSRATSAGRIYYEPMLVDAPIVVLDFVLLNVIVNDAGTPGGLRVGIYAADVDWQPTLLVVDAGAFDTSSTGAKTITLGTPQALAPGRYLIANLSNSSTSSFRCYTGNMPGGNGIVPGNTTNALRTAMYVAQSYGALPSTVVPWTNDSNGNTPFIHSVFLGVSTP